MSFTSEIFSRELFIDDYTERFVRSTTHVNGQPVSRGLVPRDKSIPQPFMTTFNIPLIPREEWPERIEEMEKTQTRLSDYIKRQGMKCKNQDGLPYCWIFATVSAVEAARAFEGKPYVSLSPASVGAPLKNYRREGGWGTEGLRWLIEHGVAPSELWPDCAVDRSLDNEQTRLEREKYKATEWYELPDDRTAFDAMFTCLLLRMPVSIGLNWWGHQVLACDPLLLPGKKFGPRILNSWGEDWSDNGFGVLNESKGTPDDACVPFVVT